MSKPVALVTGASSGIGRELARVLAAQGYDLVIVARRYERLTELASELSPQHGTAVRLIKADLCDPSAPDRIMAELDQANLPIDVLINDAGLGRTDSFAQMAWPDIESQISVNIIALTHLTRLLLPGMISRKHGRILNVGSIAGYLPGPGMAIYYATKAFVFSLSEALWQETHGTGVTVAVLCPGLTHTEFHQQAHQSVGRFGWMSAASVARIGYQAMITGRRVVNAGGLNTLIAGILRLVPHRILLMAGKVARRR